MALVSNWVNWGPEKWDMRNEIPPWRSSSYLVAKPWPGTRSPNISQFFSWSPVMSLRFLSIWRDCFHKSTEWNPLLSLPQVAQKPTCLILHLSPPRSPRLENQQRGEKNNGRYHSVGIRTRGDVSRQTSAHYSCPNFHCVCGTSRGHCPDLSLFHPAGSSWSSSSVNEQLGQMNG